MNYNSEQTERGRCLTTFLHMSANESHYFNTLKYSNLIHECHIFVEFIGLENKI
jgi:hypothetical protein